MKQTSARLSTYTADVSGVCSALFELGGMTVMHDASGCNSTYNTHDEPRWYDQDSLVFISGLSEMEAIMGDDEKLITDMVDAAQQLKPRFIALAGTPIPMMVGCDIPAIAAQVEQQTGIPCFGFQTNGMHSYVAGVSMALAAYAARMTRDGAGKTPTPSVNLLGVTPLDFSVNGSSAAMCRLLEDHGWQVVGCWAMESAPEALENAGCAHVNLVVSSVGLAAAEVLRQKFGTPYVIGTPVGGTFSQTVLRSLKTAAASGINVTAFGKYAAPPDAPLAIVGEGVTARSLAAAIRAERGLEARVLCPLEAPDGILSAGDAALEYEDEIIAALRSAKMVIADPMYRPLVPAACRFFDLPHEACSGRLYRNAIPNLIGTLSGGATL